MTDESVKARIERGDWVSLDEVFPELVPSDLKEEIKAAIAEAASYGGVSVIERQMRDARTAEQARQHGSNVPPSPGRMISTVDAAKRSVIVERFQKAWSAIDAAVRRRLAVNEWQTQKTEKYSAIPVASCVWGSFRLYWKGESTFTDTFPDVWVVVPNAEGGQTNNVPLRLFQIRQVSTVPDASVPKTVALTNRTTRSPSESGCLAAELAREFWLDEGEEYRSGDGKQAKCMNFVQGGLVAAGYEQMSKSGLSPIIKRESKRIRDEKAQFRDGSEKVLYQLWDALTHI